MTSLHAGNAPDAAPAGPVALVTGARRGIGKATAVALAADGFRVAVTSRSTGGGAGADALTLAETVAAVEVAGSVALSVALDLASRASVDAALNRVYDTWGRVDVVVNNALAQPAGGQSLLVDLDAPAFEEMVVGQVVNTTYLVKRVLDRELDHRTITIVNVGSGATQRQWKRPFGAGGVAYSYVATKAAFHHLSTFLDLELRERGVRAFTVDPGLVRTEAVLETFGDVPGACTPDVPADVIRWLARDPASDELRGSYIEAQRLHQQRLA